MCLHDSSCRRLPDPSRYTISQKIPTIHFLRLEYDRRSTRQLEDTRTRLHTRLLVLKAEEKVAAVAVPPESVPVEELDAHLIKGSESGRHGTKTEDNSTKKGGGGDGAGGAKCTISPPVHLLVCSFVMAHIFRNARRRYMINSDTAPSSIALRPECDHVINHSLRNTPPSAVNPASESQNCQHCASEEGTRYHRHVFFRDETVVGEITPLSAPCVRTLQYVRAFVRLYVRKYIRICILFSLVLLCMLYNGQDLSVQCRQESRKTDGLLQ